MGTLEVEFERTLNSKSSFGLSAFTTFDDSGKTLSYEYGSGITGFYKYYLGKKYASGLFFEGFGMFHNTRYPVINQVNVTKVNSNLLVGLGLGYKHVLKNGLIIQANYSPGINIFNNKFGSKSGRAGISLGFRF